MTSTTRTPTVLGLAAAVLITLTACGNGSGGSADEPSQEQSSSSGSESQGEQGAQPDLEGIPDVVAEVNGEEVTKEEFVATYEARFQQAAMQAQMGGGQAPDEDALKEQTAQGLVDTELLRQEAEDRGISATEADVDKEITSVAKQNQLPDAQAFLDALEKQGTSEEQVRDQVQTQLLVEGLVEDEAGSIEPSEKDLRTLYQQAKQQQAAMGQQGGQQQKIPPFAKVRSQLEDQAVSQEQGKVAQQLVDDLRKDADITVNL